MCGICGFTGPEDKDTLNAMVQSIVHRGPDEDGFFSDGSVNLGMRRLSIIDLESGSQPMHNEDRSLWCICNGELYNFQELRTRLGSLGHRFYTDHSDVETIVHLHEQYGEDFPSEINGMFAIALWDSRKKSLLLIRDRMGVKPLFYAQAGGRVIFGSEIKAILKHPAYSPEPDYASLYHYLSLKNIPSPMSAFAGVQSLLPGEMVRIDANGSVTRRRWWKVFHREDDSLTEAVTTKRIVEILDDATRLRMISDVPFGAYLSGGVDSSTIVALMTRHAGKAVTTFSLGYEDELSNKEADLYHARRVSKQFNTDHHEYIMSSSELVEDVARVIEAFDQPFSGTISTYFLSKLITQHVKVALSGDGADEIFGSYLSHRVAAPMKRFGQMSERAFSGELTKEEIASLRPCDVDFLKGLYERAGHSAREVDWRYQLYVTTDEGKSSLISDEFRRRIGQTSTRSLIEHYFNDLSARDPLNRMLEMEWNTQLPDQVLAFVDFLSMAHSVEVRSPFLDYRLVEFAATIPGEMKIQGGNVKDILKRAVAPLLPEGIVNRPKEGFVLPVFDWMTGKLSPYIEGVLSPERLSRHGLIDLAAAADVRERFLSGDRSYSASVWNLMMFQLWWEEYFG
jgi:asparagine synthase (glutamine-hydrolysing)